MKQTDLMTSVIVRLRVAARNAVRNNLALDQFVLSYEPCFNEEVASYFSDIVELIK